MWKTILSLAFLLCFSGISFAGGNDTGSIFLTNNITERRDVSGFDCRDTIFAGLKGIKAKGRHTIEAYWINPDGIKQQYSKHEFNSISGSTDAWVWLELHPGTGGRLLSGIDPSAGMDGFTGKWSVRIYLDDMLKGEIGFLIAC